jgi:hypothetical protein
MEAIDLVQETKGTAKFAADKIIRAVAEIKPELIYPYADVLISLLDSTNNFIKWGTILTIPYLVDIEDKAKLETAILKLKSLTEADEMVTSMNALDSLHKLSASLPELDSFILIFLLDIDKRKYYKKGELSPECTNIAIGKAIDIFSNLPIERISNEIVLFANRNKNNPRAAVKKKIEKFLKKLNK